MDIEQLPPKRPDFLLIVGLFCGTILVTFVVAWLFIRFSGKHITFRHHHAHPTSQLVLPANDPTGNGASSTLA